jgi:hypothetical protein
MEKGYRKEEVWREWQVSCRSLNPDKQRSLIRDADGGGEENVQVQTSSIW